MTQRSDERRGEAGAGPATSGVGTASDARATAKPGPASLAPLFRPTSVAVVGASRDPQSIGHRIVEALLESRFTGPVYPVNPKAHSVCSIRAYPSVRDLPEAVDLALISVPRDAVLDAARACAERGVKALVVITAGFAEVSEEGRSLQKELVECVRAAGMRMVGPNCMGVLNADPEIRLNASFSPIFPPPGRVAMASQSGALGLAILGLAREKHLGLSSFASVGNKADVSGNDLLEYWEADPGTDVILLYLESFGNPRRFARIARRVGRTKPIVAVKGGRTPVGQRAAGSHTAALAASEAAVEAVFRQTGVIHAERLEEMFDLAAVLGTQPLPPGRSVAIVTNAGGPGILCADACAASGLCVPQLASETRARLATFLPAAASLENPVDLIASADPAAYRRAVATVLGASEVDSLVVIYIPVLPQDLAPIVDAIGEGIRLGRDIGGAGKPVLACLMGDVATGPPLVMGREKIPVYRFPEAPARVLAQVAAYAAFRSRPPGAEPKLSGLAPEAARTPCRRALAAGGGWLSAEETRSVLAAFGLPVVEGGLARTADEAARLARSLGFPVAVKLASHTIVHKTEMGGVRLDLRDEAGVRAAFDDIRARIERDGHIDAMEGVLVQRMLTGGVELMVGVTEDPSFGPLVAFGLGGIHVEILGDVTFGVTPLTDRDAAEMVRSLKGHRLLEGYRGHPPADLAALEDVLLRVSRLAEEVPEIAEMDLNPVYALPPGSGCRILDARIRVAPRGPAP